MKKFGENVKILIIPHMPEKLPNIGQIKVEGQHPGDLAHKEYEKRKRITAGVLKDAEKEKDPKRELIARCKEVENWMFIWWGVDNLSTIEGVRLRNIVEKVFADSKRDYEREENGDSPGMFMIDDPVKESAVRWLWEMYGINFADLPTFYILEDETTGERRQYNSNYEGDLFFEEQERLQKMRHKIRSSMLAITPDDIKDYLRDLREKSHKI